MDAVSSVAPLYTLAPLWVLHRVSFSTLRAGKTTIFRCACVFYGLDLPWTYSVLVEPKEQNKAGKYFARYYPQSHELSVDVVLEVRELHPWELLITGTSRKQPEQNSDQSYPAFTYDVA